MIVPKQEMLSLTGESDSFDLDFTHRGVEKEVKNYCAWEIESGTYTNRLVDGTGTSWLDLGLKNVTALSRIAIDTLPAIKIKHSTASSNAYAKVNYTDNAPISLGLEVDDGADESSATNLFATYPTMTTLIAQITGNGWSAEIYDSDYGAFGSTNLLQIDNLACGTWDGADPGWQYLYMPGEPIRDFEISRDEGSLYLNRGWPSGVKNIPVTVTAGWTTANMPADLKRVVAVLVKYFYRKHQLDSTGIKMFDLGDLRIEYITETRETGASSIPIEILDVLDLKYKVRDLL
jgi:hypothetical protein